MTTSDKHSNQGSRPAGITCPSYEAIPGRKHCRHYLANGGCSRPDEFMCREWLKANGHTADDPPAERAVAEVERYVDAERQAIAASPVDLFGNPNPDFRPPAAKEPAPPAQKTPVKPPTRPQPAPDQVDVEDERPAPRGLTTDDIESFKALGVEVCIASEAIGEVWLVPEYTGKDRKELTPEHAATLCRIVEAFPGSRVVSFEKNPTTNEEAKA